MAKKKRAIPKKNRSESLSKGSTPKKKRARKKKPTTKKAATRKTPTPPPISQVPISATAVRARAQQAYINNREHLLTLPGVLGVSVGPRFCGGKQTEQIAIRLHMESKKAKAKLRSDAIAGREDLQPDYEGIPVDLVAWKYETTASGPLPDGHPIGSGGGSGTLGMTVRASGENRWLTAAHVIATTTNLPNDQDVTNSQGDTIGHVPGGVFSRFFFKLNKFADAALIIPHPPFTAKLTPERRIREVFGSDEGGVVSMRGAVSGDKSGTMQDVVNDGIPVPPHGMVQKHFYVSGGTQPFAKKGDSGAMVFSGNDVLGQVRFAVFEDGDPPTPTPLAVVSQMFHVSDQLNFTI